MAIAASKRSKFVSDPSQATVEAPSNRVAKKPTITLYHMVRVWTVLPVVAARANTTINHVSNPSLNITNAELNSDVI
jgi:hypothetical protein